MKRKLFGLFLLGSLVTGPMTASAALGSPLTELKKAQNSLHRLARARASDAKLKGAVNKLIDFDLMAQNTLRVHWAKLTAAQRTEFKKAFQRLLEKKYIKGVRKKATYRVDYKREVVRGGKAKVYTEVHYKKKGRPRQTDIVYRMRKVGGKWVVYDVVTDDVSMERNYRNSFNRIIKRKGFDELLRKLKKKAGA